MSKVTTPAAAALDVNGFAASALKAAAGNKAAALEAAAHAVARALFLVIESGNTGPLKQAAAVKFGKSARAALVQASFAAAVAAVPSITVAGGMVKDSRKGEARRAGVEAAAAAQTLALQAFMLEAARVTQALSLIHI